MGRIAWIVATLVVGAVLFVAATNFAAFRGEGENEPIFRNGTIVYEANGNIRMVDPDGSNDGRVIGEPNDNVWQACPRYSPDGRSLAYIENGRVRVTQVDGSGRPVGLATRSAAVLNEFSSCGARSPDGHLLAVHTLDKSCCWRLSVLSLTDGTLVQVADGLTYDRSGWAPDGSW